MPDKGRLKTAYALPFRVSYTRDGVLASGAPLVVVARCPEGAAPDRESVAEILETFSQLAKSGALAGPSIPPGQSGLDVGPPSFGSGREFAFALEKPRVDDRALVLLAHLFFARRDKIPLQSLELAPRGEPARLELVIDPEEESIYPDRFAKLPFSLEDEEPETGAYTFTAELEQPLSERNADILQGALGAWVDAVQAGAYGLAPIPPESSWCEPDSDEVVAWDQSVEWIVFKVEADPACIDGLLNVYASFHERCQKVRHLAIS